MHAWRPTFGLESPFTEEERDTVSQIVQALNMSEDPRAEPTRAAVRRHFEILEAFGRLMARFPKTTDSLRRGEPAEPLSSLIETLCRSSPADFDFRIPARVMPGRAMDMTEMNFYRLLRYACCELLSGHEALTLCEQAVARMRTVIYTKLVEEVLSDIASDATVRETVRANAVHALVEIWDERLTYRARECFPLLEATWEARQKIEVLGGTLMGAQEMYALFREGCDPRFVEYFTRPDPDEDEVEAFREFLFGKTAEELEDLRRTMGEDGLSCLSFDDPPSLLEDPGTALYAFFQSRFLQATARRLSGAPGPKRTAEGYVMLAFLSRDNCGCPRV